MTAPRQKNRPLTAAVGRAARVQARRGGGQKRGRGTLRDDHPPGLSRWGGGPHTRGESLNLPSGRGGCRRVEPEGWGVARGGGVLTPLSPTCREAHRRAIRIRPPAGRWCGRTEPAEGDGYASPVPSPRSRRLLWV